MLETQVELCSTIVKRSTEFMSQLTFNYEWPSAVLSPDEIYDQVDKDENLLPGLAEDRRVERKPPGIHSRALGDYFSMWSNTAPHGGLIIVGIEDDGQFSGCHKLSTDQLNECERSHVIYCPDAKVESKRVRVTAADGQPSFVIVFRVYYRQDKVLCDSSGHAFVRIADCKHRMSAEEIRELQIDKGQVDVEQEPVPLCFPADFNQELVRRFIDGLKRLRQPLEDHSDEELFEHRHLGRMSGARFNPNVACALLFARDPMALFPGCKIRFLRVDGEIERSGEHYNIVKDIPIEGPVPLLIAEAAAVLSSQLREFSRLGEDGIFYTAPEYPYAAWYEALVNACVHRSYGLKNMNVFIKMFDDKLVIESPGGFPPFVTPENIYTSHHPRNPHLMNAMFYLEMVKEHAEGTKRMRDTMANMRLPEPEFKQTESGAGYSSVRVTLRNHIKQRKFWVDSDASRILGEAMSQNLTPEERRVVNFIAENGSINVTQCHRLISSVTKWHTAKRILEKMVARGLLRHVHSPTIERDSRAFYTLPEAFMPRNDALKGKKP